MSKPIYILATVCILLAHISSAQRLNNDGFQRRNGQMYILRNGQTRPMLRDARLPTGAVITKDGFIVGATGKRTELREGQGCDLKGSLVSVVSTKEGGLALSAPATRRKAATPAVQEVRVVLADLFGRDHREEEGREEYDEKYEEKAHEQRKKLEEWEREERKRREEHEREREKKWKEKWKKGKKWDD